jgi:hypothetical protein
MNVSRVVRSFDGEEEATEVRARVLPASSSKMRAAAIAFHAQESAYHAQEIARLAAEAEEDDASAEKGESPWMPLAAYASYRKVSVDTIKRAIAEGLPVAGKGRLRRVHKGEADRWWK